MSSYATPPGGLPPQTQLTTNRAKFTEAYAVLPHGTMTDIVTSFLPFWDDTRLWVIARPLTGFSETFSQYIVEVSPGGGSERPETDPVAESVLFVVDGALTLTLDGTDARAGHARLRLPAARSRTGSCATTLARRRRSTGSARPTSGSTGSTYPRRS